MVDYDPYADEIKDDPYPVYRRLRAESPVHYMPKYDAWALARFDDIWDASEDSVHYSVRHSNTGENLLFSRPQEMVTLAGMDPPAHTELRAKMFPHFSPRAARQLEERIRGFARDCMRRFASQGRCDAVRDFSGLVAYQVACAVSGFPTEDAEYLIELVRRFFRRQPGVDGTSPDGQAAQQEMFVYLEDLVRARQKNGSTTANPIDVLLAHRQDGEPLTVREVAQHLVLLLVGATETFPKVFATGLLRLWQHPDQRLELRDDPGLIPDALTEILRYDMPTQWLGRTVIRDVRIRDHQLRAGQPVLFLYPSGNRDEREFDQPDVFDIHRRAPRILSFGHGVHRCMGANFAKMEGKVLLEETLRHFPDYEVLTDELEREPTEFVQGYSRFPIAFEPFSID